MNTQKKWYYLLCLCFILEAGSLSFLRGVMGKYASPLLFIIAAMLGVYISLRWIRNSREPSYEPRSPLSSLFVYTLISAVVVLAAWLYLRTFFKDYPIDPKFSDIIPLIKKIGDRFTDGQQVYQPINDFGYPMYPNYLPGTWMPFLIAERLQLDYRTWAFIIFSAALFLCVWNKQGVKMKERIAGLLFLFVMFLLFLWSQPSAFGWTVEMMITGFYLLLLWGIYRQNIWVTGISVLLCLLSRYAIILWLPALFILLFLFDSKRKAIYTAIIVLTGIMIAFILPFYLSNPGLLSNGYAYYTTGTLAEWKGQSWQQPGDLPFQLSRGYGFAIWFYHWGKGELPEKIKWMQVIHFTFCAIIPVCSLAWYWVKGRKWLPLKWCLLLSLKLYLVFFYAFIQLPYAYLFFTSLMVSALVMLWLSMRQALTSPA